MFTNNNKELKLELKSLNGAHIDLSLVNPTDEQVNALIVDVIIPVMNPNYLKDQFNRIVQDRKNSREEVSFVQDGRDYGCNDQVISSALVEEEKEESMESGVGTSEELTNNSDYPIVLGKEPIKEDTLKVQVYKDRAKSGFSVAELFSSDEETSQKEEIAAMKRIFEVPAVEEKDRESDFHRTGIKVNANNKKKYRLGYICPKCGNSGRHYIPPFVKVVSCHECQTLLDVEPSTVNGFGEGDQYRDSHGNYFVAMTLNLVE